MACTKRFNAVLGVGLISIQLSGIAALAAPAVAEGREPTFGEKLSGHIRSYDIEGRSLAECLLDLAYRYKLPLGIEYINQQVVADRSTLKFSSQTLREVISSMVARVPGYRVDFSGGLVDVYSTAGRRDASNTLNIIIPDFSVREVDLGFANFKVAEALQRTASPDAMFAGDFIGAKFGRGKITLHLQGKRVYEILNAVIAEDGGGVWLAVVPPAGLRARGPHVWRVYALDAPLRSVALDQVKASFQPNSPDSHH
jgi:hypothetical protein